MSTKTAKGSVVPAAGDDLLAAWPAYDLSVGTIVQAASISAMRVTLATADASGQGPTKTYPWYFDLNGSGIIYRADGTKGASSVYELVPINQSEFVQDSSTATWTFGLGSDAYQELVKSSLPVRPYDRRVQATWTCFAQIQAGLGEAYVRVGSDVALGRYSEDASGTTQSVTIQGIVRAGTDPAITAGIHGAWGQSGMSMQATNSNRAYSRLVVSADPITMS